MELYLFDMDGTTILTEDIYFIVWSKIIPNLSRQDFDSCISGNTDKIALQKLGGNYDLEKVSEHKTELFKQHISCIKLIEGVEEYLVFLKGKGFKTGLVTNSNLTITNLILNTFNLADLFDIVVVCDEALKPKPYPDPYLFAMNSLGVSPKKTVIFEAAKSSGARFVVGLTSIFNDYTLVKELGVSFSIPNYSLFLKIERLLI